MKITAEINDCRNCQWGWLSEKGDKYDEEGWLICDNGASFNCGRIVGNLECGFDIECQDFEEPL